MTKTLKFKGDNVFYLAEVSLDFSEIEKLENILDAKIFTNNFENELIGPHLTFNTPWSSNVLQIVERGGIRKVHRVE